MKDMYCFYNRLEGSASWDLLFDKQSVSVKLRYAETDNDSSSKTLFYSKTDGCFKLGSGQSDSSWLPRTEGFLKIEIFVAVTPKELHDTLVTKKIIREGAVLALAGTYVAKRVRKSFLLQAAQDGYTAELTLPVTDLDEVLTLETVVTIDVPDRDYHESDGIANSRGLALGSVQLPNGGEFVFWTKPFPLCIVSEPESPWKLWYYDLEQYSDRWMLPATDFLQVNINESASLYSAIQKNKKAATLLSHQVMGEALLALAIEFIRDDQDIEQKYPAGSLGAVVLNFWSIDSLYGLKQLIEQNPLCGAQILKEVALRCDSSF